jgi:hypothetical protein
MVVGIINFGVMYKEAYNVIFVPESGWLMVIDYTGVLSGFLASSGNL